MPTVTGLNITSQTLSDGVQASETLGSFTVEDPNDGANINCSIQAPNAALFQLTTVATSEYRICSFNVWS